METSKLAEITRGEMVESTHRGIVVVVDAQGNNIFSKGNPKYLSFIRSAAKPIQAIPILELGVDKAFDFNDQELAVITGSHSGEVEHEQSVRGILTKIGLKDENLLCGTTKPIHKPTANKMFLENIKPGPLHCPCSGKHAGMLAISVHQKFTVNDYYLLEHPVQQLMLETMAQFSEMGKKDIKIGIDGCGVPVFGMSIKSMAIAYANYARPDKFSFQRQTACQKLSKVMVKYPHLVAGSGRFTTFLLEQLGSKLIAKDGSEGIFCIGLPREGLGIAIKIEDGSARALAPVVLRVLDELGILNKQEKEALEPYYYPQIRNFRNEVIGRIRAAF